MASGHTSMLGRATFYRHCFEIQKVATTRRGILLVIPKSLVDQTSPTKLRPSDQRIYGKPEGTSSKKADA